MQTVVGSCGFVGGICVVQIYIQAGQDYLQQIPSIYLIDSDYVCVYIYIYIYIYIYVVVLQVIHVLSFFELFMCCRFACSSAPSYACGMSPRIFVATV